MTVTRQDTDGVPALQRMLQGQEGSHSSVRLRAALANPGAVVRGVADLAPGRVGRPQSLCAGDPSLPFA